MKLFLDTGNLKDIETLHAIGIIDGITTNRRCSRKSPAITKRTSRRSAPSSRGR